MPSDNTCPPTLAVTSSSLYISGGMLSTCESRLCIFGKNPGPFLNWFVALINSPVRIPATATSVGKFPRGGILVEIPGGVPFLSSLLGLPVLLSALTASSSATRCCSGGRYLSTQTVVLVSSLSFRWRSVCCVLPITTTWPTRDRRASSRLPESVCIVR